MKLQTFIDEHVGKKSKDGTIKVTSAINKRWETRIVTQGLDSQGTDGARAYLARYGNNIAAPKVIDLALCAQAKGAQEMAMAFWIKAYELTFGSSPKAAGDTALESVSSATGSKVKELPMLDELPDHLQPGKIHTMQAVDAPEDREYYINSPSYIGQPKRDGHRTLVIATPDKVWFQTRNLNLIDISDNELVNYFKEAAKRLSPFVLDGELWYRSFDGKEHRTAAQAAEWNIRCEKPTEDVRAVYTAFKPLYFAGVSLTDEPESRRIQFLEKVVWLPHPDNFEICPTARTTEEKKALVEKQITEGREGEVWINSSCRYAGGKNSKSYPMVRTKYIQILQLVCTGVTPTTSENRLFGSIKVAEEVNGKLMPVGKVGSGFDMSSQKEIMAKTSQGNFKVFVATQGRTASGKLMHARYQGMVEDDAG
ncbi:MAG: ATP-dependent DNA ligase [Anaerolineales bacterium]|nr:ATP-dependent DNA ligase [Anaerolineales bacterium]